MGGLELFTVESETLGITSGEVAFTAAVVDGYLVETAMLAESYRLYAPVG